MDKTRPRGNTYTLWGGALSLYTGKVRSYLIKAGIPYREYYTVHPEYRERVLPVVRLGVAPILETPDGQTVQDTTDIIECLEARHPATSMIPETPVQRAVAWLISGFGSDGLLQASMHYRWSYAVEQKPWLLDEFGRFSSTAGREQRHAAASSFMVKMNAMLPALGVTPDTCPAIEGGRPSIADFGLMAAMFGHLGRDPVPAHLMKLMAANVHRWTERMNLAGSFDLEFPDTPDEYVPDDGIPATVEPMLRHIFQDWGPELLASAAHYNEWVRANPDLPAGSPPFLAPTRRLVHPMLGPVSDANRGVVMSRHCAPQSLWHFDKSAQLARRFEGAALTLWRELLERTGGTEVMTIRLARPMKRHDYLVVLA